MDNARTRFTALGMSGSGKTCYVIGMYYQMITGHKGFSLNGMCSERLMITEADDETGLCNCT